eukprot:1164421-Pyramimonas_sp.AAC.1
MGICHAHPSLLSFQFHLNPFEVHRLCSSCHAEVNPGCEGRSDLSMRVPGEWGAQTLYQNIVPIQEP